jgi:hypothetical protein
MPWPVLVEANCFRGIEHSIDRHTETPGKSDRVGCGDVDMMMRVGNTGLFSIQSLRHITFQCFGRVNQKKYISSIFTSSTKKFPCLSLPTTHAALSLLQAVCKCSSCYFCTLSKDRSALLEIARELMDVNENPKRRPMMRDILKRLAYYKVDVRLLPVTCSLTIMYSFSVFSPRLLYSTWAKSHLNLALSQTSELHISVSIRKS